MPYNNGFPVGYQPMVLPQYSSVPQTNTQQQTNGIIWVQGEAGAKSYLVAPNNTVQLWDSEAQVIYLKSADASGMPSMKVLEYTIRDGGAVQNSTADFATKEDVEALQRQIDALTKPKKKEGSDK